MQVERPDSALSHEGPAEVELVARAQRGDREAVAELFRRHYDGLVRFLLGSGCRPDDVEDCVQETFVRALRAMERFQNKGRFASWLRRIGLNWIRDRARRAREVPVPPDRFQDLLGTQYVDVTERVADPGLLALLGRFPPDQRAVLVLRFVEDLSLEEIARITRSPVGTVKSRLHYGLRRLRRLLEESGEQPAVQDEDGVQGRKGART